MGNYKIKNTMRPEMYMSDAVRIYDKCPAPDFKQVLRFINNISLIPGYAYDVGCGTGSLIYYLSKQGWLCAGCDLSPDMVLAARYKNPGCEIEQATVANFKVQQPVKLITCTFDVLNHLSSLTAVNKFFKKSFLSLQLGGILIFDSVTPQDIKCNWPGYIEVDEIDGILLVRTGKSLGPRTGVLKYEYFVQNKNKLWRRFTEIHTLRALPLDWMRDALSSIGFTKIKIVDASSLKPPTEKSVRWLVSACKPKSLMK